MNESLFQYQIKVKMHDNKALDIETADGYTLLICFSDGSLIEDVKYNLDKIFAKLIAGNSNTRYFSWNLRFDIDGILKYLPRKNIEEILDDRKTIYNNWELRYLGRNQLAIKDIEKERYGKVWDIAGFYNYMTLESAARKYLDYERKIDSPIIQAFVTDKNTIDFYNENRKEIIEYCQQDAKITKLLADEFEKKCEREGYDFSSPYSIGNMGIKFFRNYLYIEGKHGKPTLIPRIHPSHWYIEDKERRQLEEDIAYFARGGWNDVYQRGRFEEVYDADIVSAYPYIMKSAPYWAGEWEWTDKEKDIEDYDYGLVTGRIEKIKYPLIPEVYLEPSYSYIKGEKIIWKNREVFWCVVEKSTPIVLPLSQWKYLRDYGDFKFRQADYLIPDKDYYPLKPAIEELFRRKKQAEKGTMEYNLAKVLMNGVSGKFIQRQHSNKTFFFYPHLYSYITWKTKEMLLNLIFENDLWDSIVSIATDGIALREKPNKIKLGKELGDWELIRLSPFFQIGNGIYMGQNEDGHWFTRERGFYTSERESENFVDRFEKNRDKSIIEIETRRPIHLREAFKHNKILSLDDVNRFIPVVRKLDINYEVKRKWDGKYRNIDELLSGRVLQSSPWEVHEAMRKAKEIKKQLEKDR